MNRSLCKTCVGGGYIYLSDQTVDYAPTIEKRDFVRSAADLGIILMLIANSYCEHGKAKRNCKECGGAEYFLLL
jgi:hypothetical protein